MCTKPTAYHFKKKKKAQNLENRDIQELFVLQKNFSF